MIVLSPTIGTAVDPVLVDVTETGKFVFPVDVMKFPFIMPTIIQPILTGLRAIKY